MTAFGGLTASHVENFPSSINRFQSPTERLAFWEIFIHRRFGSGTRPSMLVYPYIGSSAAKGEVSTNLPVRSYRHYRPGSVRNNDWPDSRV
ncbi:hypothetical protein Trydic_g17663 [Trypoxylus dichotomus]